MKNSKAVGIMLAIVIIVQCVFFSRLGNDYYTYSFAYGIKNESTDPIDIIYILFLLVPVFFNHFYFSESVYRLTHGYGKLYIIRQYSKNKLIMREITRIILSVFVIIFFQGAVSFFFKGDLKPLNTKVLLMSLGSYTLGIFAVILLQMLMEFFIKPQQASMAAVIYTFISYFVSYYITDCLPVKILFFPCLMFGSQNGAGKSPGYYAASVIILAAASICLIIGNMYKFKKTDIF